MGLRGLTLAALACRLNLRSNAHHARNTTGRQKPANAADTQGPATACTSRSHVLGKVLPEP